MARFAQASQGVFFQIAVGVAPEVGRGELVAVPLSDRMLARGRLALVTRRGRTLPPAAARLAEHLAATLRAG
jgi:DNA-binding transcriptional LysR family regulator